MPDFLIREMRLEEYEDFVRFSRELHRLHHESRPDLFRPQLTVMPQQVYEQDLKSPSRRFLAAEADGKLVGFCDLRVKETPNQPDFPLEFRRVLHLEDVYVTPAFRRRGVATALLQTAADVGRKLQADEMTLMVWAFNDAALSFYRKLGFSPLYYQMEMKL